MSTATAHIETEKRSAERSRSKLVPKLRFKEFDEEWNFSKMLEVASKITDGTHNTPQKVDEGIPYMTAIHVRDGSIDFESCYYLSQEDHDKIYKRCNPEFGDLLIVNIGAGTATCASVSVDYQFSLKNVALVKPNKKILEPDYLTHLQRKKSKRLFHELTSGGAQPFFSLKQIGKLKVEFPSIPEQQKIASFLSAVDEKIQQLTIKKALLEQYKKGVMQQLFSGRLRFKDENGNPYPDWEEKRLGDVLTIGSGKDYKHLKVGDIPVYGTGGYMTSVNEYLFDGESVGIGRKGTIDKPVFLSGKFWTVDTLFYTHSFKRVFPFFIYLIFQTINWKLYNEASGVPSLSKSTIEKIELKIPIKEEQQKIANYLSSIDTKIESVKNQITQTQTFKKGLLQQLFVQSIVQHR